MNRFCATPNCNRDTARPADPESSYRYCSDCTRHVLRTGAPPVLVEPVLVRLARQKKLPAKALTHDGVAA